MDINLISKVVLNTKIIENLIDYTKNNLPAEVCGVLFGKVEDDIVYVTSIIYLKNVIHSASRFKIDPIELYNVYIEGEKVGLDLVGIFHSHNTLPYPSPTDIHYMELNPVPWLILGLIEKKWVIKGYKFFRGKAESLKIIELTY